MIHIYLFLLISQPKERHSRAHKSRTNLICKELYLEGRTQQSSLNVDYILLYNIPWDTFSCHIKNKNKFTSYLLLDRFGWLMYNLSSINLHTVSIIYPQTVFDWIHHSHKLFIHNAFTTTFAWFSRSFLIVRRHPVINN